MGFKPITIFLHSVVVCIITNNTYPSNSFKNSSPSSQTVYPDATLICPALPISTNLLPQQLAK